jgi:two-component system cell cycle sensor histidine kinase/response regulator CckA
MPAGEMVKIETANREIVDARLHAQGQVPPGQYVIVRLQDAGTGIDAATLLRIFEPFFTTKEPGKGTGLGLSTVYGIVRQSAGYIGVDSAVGRGTTFTIYLPRITESTPRRTVPYPGGRRGRSTKGDAGRCCASQARLPRPPTAHSERVSWRA